MDRQEQRQDELETQLTGIVSSLNDLTQKTDSHFNQLMQAIRMPKGKAPEKCEKEREADQRHTAPTSGQRGTPLGTRSESEPQWEWLVRHLEPSTTVAVEGLSQESDTTAPCSELDANDLTISSLGNHIAADFNTLVKVVLEPEFARLADAIAVTNKEAQECKLQQETFALQLQSAIASIGSKVDFQSSTLGIKLDAQHDQVAKAVDTERKERQALFEPRLRENERQYLTIVKNIEISNAEVRKSVSDLEQTLSQMVEDVAQLNHTIYIDLMEPRKE